MTLMRQQIGGMERMPMQNRMESISKITHPAIFYSNSTCYNCGTPGHHAVKCPVPIICRTTVAWDTKPSNVWVIHLYTTNTAENLDMMSTYVEWPI